MEPPEPSITRRQALAIAGSSVAIAGCAGDGGDDQTAANDSTTDADGDRNDTGGGQPDEAGGALADVPDAVTLEPVVEGIDRPVATAFAPGESLQYVVEQPGRIVGIDEGRTLDQPVLDHTDSVVSEGNEQGMLGLAFHPDFQNNRLAYVRYSAPPREGTPTGWSHTFVLAEFSVSEDGTTFVADSEQTILEIPEPWSNHNAGDLAFGPDGYLYVPVGDGGAADDQGLGHVDDWYDAVDGGNGQDVSENLLGSILRIDVDGGDPYAIPDDNPLDDGEGLREHYAWGLRNPWQIAFDREDLYVADVGQTAWEEVDLVEAGGNYGWNVKEGTHCFMAEECPSQTPAGVRGGEPLRDPIVEYPHQGEGISGISVIGGQVYRGSAISGLEGVYVFGDLVVDGRFFATARGDGDGLWPTTTVAIEGANLGALYAFGRDADGELYALGQGENGEGVWRLTSRA